MLNARGAGCEHLDRVTQLVGNNCPLGHVFNLGLRLNSNRVLVQSFNLGPEFSPGRERWEGDGRVSHGGRGGGTEDTGGMGRRSFAKVGSDDFLAYQRECLRRRKSGEAVLGEYEGRPRSKF